jgi:hypothetical protein
MLIRAAQLEAFRSTAQLDFERRALDYLTENHSEYADRHGQPHLRELLAQSQLQAAAVQLGSEKGIITWAELVILYGPSFYQKEPWASYIISLDTL